MPLRTNEFFSIAGLKFTKRRLLIMPFFGLAILIVEALEHLLVRDSLFTLHFAVEVVIYSFLFPLLGGLFLFLVDKAELDRDLAVSELSQMHAFSIQLRNASGKQDLVDLITKLPGTLVPATSSALFVNNPSTGSLDFVGSWKRGGKRGDDSIPVIDIDKCQSCTLWSSSSTSIHYCPPQTIKQPKPEGRWYCMPLAFRGDLTGILKIQLPEEPAVSDQQLKKLQNFSPEIALALENYYLHNVVENQTEAQIAERDRIARDLHDTLGQNITYLRLKLDQVNEQYSTAF